MWRGPATPLSPPCPRAAPGSSPRPTPPNSASTPTPDLPPPGPPSTPASPLPPPTAPPIAPPDEGWGGFSIQHAVTRSVRDSAALLELVASPAPGDPCWLEAPARPFAAEVEADPGVLRIAFTTQALASEALDPECAEAVR